MNYLAHLYLAGDSPRALVGSLAADFVKGRVPEDQNDEVRRAILLHRQIDGFTDRHPIHAESRRRVAPPRRRYAGVLVDLFYDHFLAAEWSRYSAVPLEQYCARVYAVLIEHAALLPPRLQARLPVMAAEDWLGSYATFAGIDRALRGLSRRVRRENPLAGGVEELAASYDLFRDDFVQLAIVDVIGVHVWQCSRLSTERPKRRQTLWRDTLQLRLPQTGRRRKRCSAQDW